MRPIFLQKDQLTDSKKYHLLTKYLLYFSISISFLISVHLMCKDSTTNDEYEYIGSAYALLHYPNMEMNLVHPPLIKFLAEFGLYLIDAPYIQITQNRTERLARQFGHLVFFSTGIQPQTILIASRLPILIFNYILLMLFAYQLWRLIGPLKSSVVTILFSTSPLFLGFAHLVTMDVSISLATTLAFTQFCLDSKEKHSVLMFWKSTFWACLSIWIKYNGFLVFGIFFVLVTYAVCFKKDKIGPYIFFLILLTLGLIATIYCICRYTIAHYPPITASFNQEAQIAVPHSYSNSISSVTGTLLNKLTTIEAEFFVIYIRLQKLKEHVFMAPNAVGYLMRHIYKGANPYFFILLFSLKEYFEFLLFILVGIFLFPFQIYQRIKTKNSEYLIFALLSLSYIGCTISAALQTGLRYILPLYPSLLIVSAFSIESLCDSFQRHISSKKIFFAFSLISLIHAIIVFPGYISYFNPAHRLFGEPYEIAGDSNLDWGQDVGRLDKTIETFGKIYVDVNTRVAPSLLFGSKIIEWDTANGLPPAGSIFAISAYKLAWYLFSHEDEKIRRPIATKLLKSQQINNQSGQSILLYKISS